MNEKLEEIVKDKKIKKDNIFSYQWTSSYGWTYSINGKKSRSFNKLVEDADFSELGVIESESETMLESRGYRTSKIYHYSISAFTLGASLGVISAKSDFDSPPAIIASLTLIPGIIILAAARSYYQEYLDPKFTLIKIKQKNNNYKKDN